MKLNITNDMLQKMENSFKANKANKIAMNATAKNGIIESAENESALKKLVHEYSIQIESGDITNQKKSGRCWMFAALNVMRCEIMEKLNLETMELSQNYPLFWDKLEKSNLFLENIIKTLDMPLEGREVAFLLKDPVGDGGQWDMFAGIIEKYGVVPKDAMPETHTSSATSSLDKFITLKLREFACTLRNEYSKGVPAEDLRPKKTEMLNTIYRMLCITLGEPPKTFVYEARDKDKKFVRVPEMTPQSFYREYVGMDLNNYVSLINAPTADKPFNKTYTVQFLGSVVGGQPVKYLNMPIETLKRTAIAQMKDGKSVWFGSDVGQFSLMTKGIMAMDAMDVQSLLDTDFPLTKAQRLDYGESLMTHAMVLNGVNLDENGKPNRWRVQNSWGDERGKKGYFLMTDEWFDEYTYQVVIDKKYLTAEELEMLKQEPIVLKPWDPMGSLA